MEVIAVKGGSSPDSFPITARTVSYYSACAIKALRGAMVCGYETTWTTDECRKDSQTFSLHFLLSCSTKFGPSPFHSPNFIMILISLEYVFTNN